MSSDEQDDRHQNQTTPRQRRRASRPAGAPGETSVPPSDATAKPVADSAAENATPEEVAPVPEAADDVAVQPYSESDTAAVAAEARSRPWLRKLVTGAASLFVLVLVVAVILLGMAKHAANSRDEKRQEFVDAARQSVLNLTTIHPDTAKKDVDRILAGASGDFKKEFAGKEDPFVSIVTDAKVATDGKILEAGLESEHKNDSHWYDWFVGNNPDSANVLVAARSMVSNSGNAQPTPRDFRLRLTITDDGDRMTTSKVEFVP